MCTEHLGVRQPIQLKGPAFDGVSDDHEVGSGLPGGFDARGIANASTDDDGAFHGIAHGADGRR